MKKKKWKEAHAKLHAEFVTLDEQMIATHTAYERAVKRAEEAEKHNEGIQNENTELKAQIEAQKKSIRELSRSLKKRQRK